MSHVKSPTGAKTAAVAGKTTGKRAAKGRIASGKSDYGLLFELFPGGVLMPDHVAETFGMSKAQLAATVGLKREAFYKAGRVRAPKTQARVREMLEIVSRIAGWAGGKDQAMAWYRAQPIPAFGGRTAESLVKSGQAAAVRDYLDHVAMGGFA